MTTKRIFVYNVYRGNKIKMYQHTCERCANTWKTIDYWTDHCPSCMADYTSGFKHQLRNILYGNERHPKA